MDVSKMNNSQRIKINSNKLLCLIINICLLLIVELLKKIVLGSNMVLNTQYSLVFIIALMIYSYIILSAYNRKKRVDPYIIFIIVSFFFFYGQHALVFLNVQRDDISILQGRIQDYYLIKTGYTILQCIILTYIGYVLLHINKNYTKVNRDCKQFLEDKSLYMTAFIVFLTSIIPTILYLYSNIMITLTKGYGYRIVENSNQIESSKDIFFLISRFMLPSLIAMYVSCKKKDEKKIMLIIVLYLILYTLSGSRIESFCSLCTIIYIIVSKGNKNFKKNIFKYLIIVLLVIFVFTIISDVRSSIATNGDILNQLANSVNNIWNDNFIFAALRETGYTYAVTACVFQYCPSSIAHLNGMSYISSIVYILPNFMTKGFTGKYVFVDDAFSSLMSSYGGIGSSFIAETYYNFGSFTFIFMIIIGMLWALLTNKIEVALDKNKAITYFNWVYLFRIFIFTVRSDMVYNFRVFFWYVLPISIIAYIAKKICENDYHKNIINCVAKEKQIYN